MNKEDTGKREEATERLTWEEIRERYPDQWVALSEVEYVDDDGCNVESAVVICGMKDGEYIDRRLGFVHSGKDYRYKRTEDPCGFVGVTV